MKKLLLALVLATNVFAQQSTVENYTEKTGFALYYYQTQPDCKDANGEWDEQSGLCFFTEENQLNLTLTDGKVSAVEIATWGGNGHSCSFESKNVYDIGSALKVVEAVDAYDFESGEMKPTLCEVTLEKVGEAYKVTNNGSCNYFCGARAWLYIEEATKK